MDSPPISLIKVKHNDNSDKEVLNIKLRRDTTSEKLGLYEFKIALFDINKSEEFLLFVHNFNMTLEVSVTLQAGAKVQLFCTTVRVEVLHQYDLLSDNIERSTPLTFYAFALIAHKQGNTYAPNPKVIASNVNGVLLSMLSDIKSN